MLTLFVYILIIACARASECGECVCMKWAGTLSCYGNNITQFPLFTSDWISHVDILDTRVSELPNFSRIEWPALYSLDLRNNRDLSCSDVTQFQRDRWDLLVTTDCDDLLFTLLPHPPGLQPPAVISLDWIGGLFMIPPTVIWLLIYLYKRQKYRRRYEITVVDDERREEESNI